MICQRIRLIGRLLMTIKTINDEIQHLETIFDPKYCKDVIKSINKLAGSNENTGHFKNPTVASSLASLLKYISQILISECIVNRDDVRKKCQQFSSLANTRNRN